MVFVVHVTVIRHVLDGPGLFVWILFVFWPLQDFAREPGSFQQSKKFQFKIYITPTSYGECILDSVNENKSNFTQNLESYHFGFPFTFIKVVNNNKSNNKKEIVPVALSFSSLNWLQRKYIH